MVRKDYEADIDGGEPREQTVHVGAVFVGVVLMVSLTFALFQPHYGFASLNSILLVVLALGCKALSR